MVAGSGTCEGRVSPVASMMLMRSLLLVLAVLGSLVKTGFA